MNNKIRELTQLALTFLIVGGFIAVIWLAADTFGAWDTLQAQLQARAAEAKARELEAQAVLLREKQAVIQTNVMAFASVKDSMLVTATYMVGGVALFLAVLVIGVLLLERGKA